MSTSNPSERINPFDKSSIITEKHSDSVSSSPPISAGITRKSESDSTSTSTLDDLTKNRFEKYQGVQNQTTGRYNPPTTSTNDYYDDLTKTSSSTSSSKTYSDDKEKDSHYEPLKYTGASSTYARTSSIDTSGTRTDTTATSNIEPSVRPTDSTRTDAAKYSFGTKQFTRSSGSLSDAEILFGSKDLPTPTLNRDSDNSSIDQSNRRSFSRDNPSYTSVDSSDNIFSNSNRKEHFFQNRSLSVSSDKPDDFPADSGLEPTYRIYEGIQNEGFQDFDSPVKTSATTAPTSSTTSSSNLGSSYRSTADDDYDLK